MKNYLMPGEELTKLIVKSGSMFTNSIVKSGFEFTKIHSPHFDALEFTISTLKSSNEFTICTLKSAKEFTTSTLPYNGIPLKVQFSLSSTGSWLKLAGVDAVNKANKNEINKCVIA